MAVDLSELLALIESLTIRLDDNKGGLSNGIDALSNNIGEPEEGFGALEDWRVAAYSKIRTLQEFELVF